MEAYSGAALGCFTPAPASLHFDFHRPWKQMLLPPHSLLAHRLAWGLGGCSNAQESKDWGIRSRIQVRCVSVITYFG